MFMTAFSALTDFHAGIVKSFGFDGGAVVA